MTYRHRVVSSSSIPAGSFGLALAGVLPGLALIRAGGYALDPWPKEPIRSEVKSVIWLHQNGAPAR